MRNETIEAIGDDYTRGRLQALQDLTERLDQEAGRLRKHIAGLDQQSGEATTMANIVEKMEAAVKHEQLVGIIAATEVVTKMFAEEARGKRAEQAASR